ncbi:MAG: cobalamin B12-binding domain-containing protein [Bacillota bacterium]
MDLYNQLITAVENAEMNAVRSLITRALEQGHQADDLLNKGLIPGIEAVGKKFERDEMFIPEVLMSAKCMQYGINMLKPFFTTNGGKKLRGRMVIGTVSGDVHDLGKNLVKMMFTANGYDVIDLGINVPPEKFAAAAEEYRPDFLGLSALLTTTMPHMADTVAYLRRNGSAGKYKIMVGGAPVTEEYAREIGADYYAENAIEAVELARKIIGGD